MRRLASMIVFCAALIGAALGSNAAGGDGPAPLLLGDARPAVVDVHGAKGHLKLKCEKCHASARTSRWASDRLIPSMSLCGDCHGAARGITVFSEATGDCEYCHGAVDAARPGRGDYPRPDFRFSHKAHAGNGCVTCHPASGARRSGGKGRDVVGMRTCFDCHEKKGRGLSQCRTCHLVHGDGRMVTRFGDKLLTPPVWLKGLTHGADWVQVHAPAAGADSDYCASCHRETECQSCHSGRLRSKNVHPGDWISAHGVSTRMDNPRCTGCHRAQSFCITCHRRSGVAPDSPSGTKPLGSSSFHNGVAPEKICRRARTDITACVSCHSESSCIRCHATINPHPAGFSRRCKPLAAKNQAACVKCHDNNSIWMRCR